ncbi:MAG: GNAT family N-acetyltransferase [Acidobacteria bacterium]|nr:GNAT family N-acetyltransferase [Acidobacteriota bacterium]MBI3655170.1 GNAT family N-acetyltransferase [Acidobacteriota bacterium]
MPSKQRGDRALVFHPLTSDRWTDFEILFGERGACGGCWCMWWRLKRSEFERRKGRANKQSMRSLVMSGEVSGILAYAAEEPAGWCAIAPRESYTVLERSRVLKRIDDKPVWSVTCLFVKKEYRNKGVSVQLLRAAVAFVKAQGGTIVEGYPVEPKTDRMPDIFAWTGLVSAFQQAGFVERARRSQTRPIMRFEIKRPRKSNRREVVG